MAKNRSISLTESSNLNEIFAQSEHISTFPVVPSSVLTLAFTEDIGRPTEQLIRRLSSYGWDRPIPNSVIPYRSKSGFCVSSNTGSNLCSEKYNKLKFFEFPMTDFEISLVLNRFLATC